MNRITERLTYLDRDDWGADSQYPRLGGADDPRSHHRPFRFIAPSERTVVPEHHSVMVDNDATKNIWENLPEIISKQQQVQVIRPDLGMDVPYSDCLYFMPNGRIIVCEGRGFIRSGAHTIGYNITGYGLCFMGNFQDFGPVDLSPWIPQISSYLGYLKYEIKMMNLGPKEPHRALNATFTACPGNGIIRTISRQRYTKPEEEEEEDDMQHITQVRSPGAADQFWYVKGGARFQCANMETVNKLRYIGVPLNKYPGADAWRLEYATTIVGDRLDLSNWP